MPDRYDRARLCLRGISLAGLVLLFCFNSRTAPAYFPEIVGGVAIRWAATSPPSIWNNATRTLSWALYTGNFPPAASNWPTAIQAGAAAQNAFQTHQDVIGSNINFNRLPDTSVAPAYRDGFLTLAYVPDQTQMFYGQSPPLNWNAATYVAYDTLTGAMQDADIFLNGDPNHTPGAWAVDGSPNTLDPQGTTTHEIMHLMGSNHSPYFGARIFPYSRAPVGLLQDRCLAPDDRAYGRVIYPDTSNRGGTINGKVVLSVPGNPPKQADRAVVVATDSLGIPQAVVATNSNGDYSINVPAGTYSLTVFHGTNSQYAPTSIGSDIDYSTATPFTSVTPPANVTVIDGQPVSAGNITANNPAGADIPHMLLEFQSVVPANLGFQVLFLTPGQTGTARLQVDNSSNTANELIAANQISAISFGTGITVVAGSWSTFTGPGVAPNRSTIIDVPFTVSNTATPGFRNLSITLNINGNERLFLPGVIKVMGTGGLTMTTPAAGNPVTATHPFSSPDVPLLRVQLQSTSIVPSHLEDVRIRSLTFNLAGSGPNLPAVRLWLDGGTPGAVDPAPADQRIFSGGAYTNNPIAETIVGAPGGPITFDNLCLPVLAGGTINLLLTADFPASGAGDYTASLPVGGIVAHGMFWGDNAACAGTVVTGGTQNLGTLSVNGLQQLRTTGLTVIPVGGFTPETQVSCQGTVTFATGMGGMEVEVKQLGTAFDGTGTVTSALSFASGSVVTVNVTGLTNFTSYHWRARATKATGQSPWVEFGNNSDGSVDFSVDNSTTGAPSGLQQLEIDGVTPVPSLGIVHGAIVFSGINGTNSATQDVRLEVEVQPQGTAFNGTVSAVSSFVPSGAVSSIVFSGVPTNDYQWRARTVDVYGVPSAWAVPPVNLFHMEAILEIKADGGCAGSASSGEAGSWVLWGGAGLALLLLSLKKRSAGAALGALVLVAGLSSIARADEEELPLPRSLAEVSVAAPEAPPFLLPEPLRAPVKSWGSLDAYLGVLLMDFNFDAMGTDFVRREVSGIGTGVFGLEALIDLNADWRVGVAAEIDLWSDLRIYAFGPVVSWCFSGSHKNKA
ncbi:MAG: hypothetical protein JO332_10590, partial [Planctomycetaceae bacterium]|nr:hypothetical protein [Planctomycetaceae bacterium]